MKNACIYLGYIIIFSLLFGGAVDIFNMIISMLKFIWKIIKKIRDRCQDNKIN
jgi:hypothetical protein